ncbi:hypothetical protein CDAR_519371 [Caerostris darwini]|uniref:Uncharacterized protein n=1 Tax=Caerostris darwini TaxID=1538125 RepID=A0AAV4PPS2_9ARAC|nr:hypothetical protein CDAR_519371 [Caerostris darwini]
MVSGIPSDGIVERGARNGNLMGISSAIGQSFGCGVKFRKRRGSDRYYGVHFILNTKICSTIIAGIFCNIHNQIS